MIEVPSLALQADLVAQEVDFASIGSNDRPSMYVRQTA